jgi:integrase/recombinase XerC/integrase/recombinase XerD
MPPAETSAAAAPTLSALVERYLLRCEVEAKAADTLRAYRETLGRFARVLAEDGAPDAIEEITSEHVVDYLGRFTELSKETRHRYFREVRRFFNWLVENGYIEQSPFRGMRNVNVPPRVKQPFAPEEIAALLAACGEPATDTALRNRAMVLTLLDTGVRCRELARLRLQDLDLEARRLHIVDGAKGGKQRIAAFAERGHRALRSYLSRRGTEPGPLFAALSPHGALRPGVPLQTNGVKQMLRRLGRRAGVSKVHAHRFRHTFATWAIRSGAREIDVQYLLGHSSSDMVRRYSSSYRSEQAALRHVEFSPGDQMLSGSAENDLIAAAVHLAPSRRSASPVAPTRIAPAAAPRPRFEAGQQLVARYKGEQYTCTVIERDGELVYLLPGGESFASPSAAGRTITGSNTNGYRFWSVCQSGPNRVRGR